MVYNIRCLNMMIKINKFSQFLFTADNDYNDDDDDNGCIQNKNLIQLFIFQVIHLNLIDTNYIYK